MWLFRTCYKTPSCAILSPAPLIRQPLQLKAFLSRDEGDISKEFSQSPTRSLNHKQVKELIAHRSPFLFVRSIFELEPCKKVTGSVVWSRENTRSDELNCFAHVVEAMGQMGSVLLMEMRQGSSDSGMPVFVGMENVTFNEAVFVQDHVEFNIEMKLTQNRKIGKMTGRCFTNCEKEIAKGDLLFTFLKLFPKKEDHQ
mmetsp:Transcript_26793/g.37326  ORF Transcript_26793/g.37326 Transcript_26793/m.37326 type:complete len:198 (+) Transcript_26793:66-659(+)